MRNPVETHKRKFDGSSGPAWSGDLVEAGPDGWLVVYYERPSHFTSDGAVVEHALRYFSLDLPVSILVCFDAVGAPIEFQCDAGLPSTLTGRRLEFVDLDLDLMVDASGRAYERDHATFARNRVRMGYSAEAIAAAREGMRLAHSLFEEQAPPFDGSPVRILGRVLAATGPL